MALTIGDGKSISRASAKGKTAEKTASWNQNYTKAKSSKPQSGIGNPRQADLAASYRPGPAASPRTQGIENPRQADLAASYRPSPATSPRTQGIENPRQADLAASYRPSSAESPRTQGIENPRQADLALRLRLSGIESLDLTARSATSSTEEVQASADRIEELLDSGGRFSGPFQYVSTGEITAVTEEFADLNAEEANAVFDELEERGLEDDLIREVYNQGPNRGLEPDVRGAFYDDLANKLNGENLVQIVNELKVVSTPGDDDAVVEFSSAIADHADEGVKVDVLERLSAGGGEVSRLSDETESGLRQDLDAVAYAYVFGGLENPNNVATQLGRLTDNDLKAVIESSLANTEGFIPLLLGDRDDRPFVALANAVNLIDSNHPIGARQIDRFFSASMDYLQQTPNAQVSDLSPEYRDALGDIFVNHFDSLISSNIDDATTLDGDFAEDLETFSQQILFGDPPGARQDEVAQFLSGELSGWLETAANGSPGDRATVGSKSIDHIDLADLAGQVLKHTTDGLTKVITNQELDAAQQRAANEFLVGIAFDLFVPGPDFSDVGDAFAKNGLEKIYGRIEGTTEDQILADLASRNSATIDPDGFDSLFDDIRDNIGGDSANSGDPNRHLGDVRRAFQDGYRDS